jgi:hypothetical protein
LSVSEREPSADALGSSEDTSEEKGKRPYTDRELSKMLNFIDSVSPLVFATTPEVVPA